jgi:DnaJ domain
MMSGEFRAKDMRRCVPPGVEPFPGAQEPGAAHRCAWKGCAGTGEYRAPKDRALREHYFFCLSHVRAYNAQWDFHQGLSTADMERQLREASTWGRPTWKLGTLGAGARPGQRAANGWTGKFRVDDPFGLGADTAFDEQQRKGYKPQSEPEAQALKVLNLSHPFTLEILRRRYKELAKKHHPDANGGSAEAETRMKVINAAYRTLRSALSGAT